MTEIQVYVQASSRSLGVSLSVPVNVKASVGLSGHHCLEISIGENVSVGISGEAQRMGCQKRTFSPKDRLAFMSNYMDEVIAMG